MRKKTVIIIAILIMSIGFAAISTTLIINGSAKVGENTDDFSVIFTAASLDGKDVYDQVISQNKKTITFETSDLKKINQTSVLSYEVTNNSSNYDAEVSVNCKVKDGGTAKYTSIKNELENNETKVLAKETLNGTLTVTLNKTATEEVKEEYVCELTFNAEERDALGKEYTGPEEWTFDYTGTKQSFVTPVRGTYKIELWGAKGSGTLGGLGAYVSGKINLKKNEPFILTVGANGGNVDIRTDNSLLSRIMVAGSGGNEFRYNECNHGYDPSAGGAAGGLVGYSGKSGTSGTAMIREAQGGSQTAGGLFGYGNEYADLGKSGSFGTAGAVHDSITGDGGSGYYGGGSSGRAWCNGGSGGGGSSFISGHDGCDAISKESTETNIIHTGKSLHYSGYKFTDTIMIDGTGCKWTTEKTNQCDGMPSHDGTSTIQGNTGNGYARITLIK